MDDDPRDLRKIPSVRRFFDSEEVSMSPDSTTSASHEVSHLDHRLNDIGWGLLFMLTGLVWLVPAGQVPPGTWLSGVAAILIGTNIVRYAKHIRINGFSLVLGCLALVAALGQLWRVDLPLLAMCLLLIGASLVVKPLLTRTT